MSAPSRPEHYPAVHRIRVPVASRTAWRLPNFVPFCPCGWHGERRYTKAAALRQAQRHVEETGHVGSAHASIRRSLGEVLAVAQYELPDVRPPLLCPYHGFGHWPANEMEGAIVESRFALCWAVQRLSKDDAVRLLYEGRIPPDLYERWHDLWERSQFLVGRIVADGDGLRFETHCEGESR